MRKLLALSALALAGVAHAQTTPSTADIEKGLLNLARVYNIAFSIEFQRHTTGNARVSDVPDPWGTPYKLEGSGASYRITSAGTDKVFQEANTLQIQFEGLAGDVVFADGRMLRSNRNWLVRNIAEGNAELERLRESERQYMVMRVPEMLDAIAVRTTFEAIRALGNVVQEHHQKKGSLAELRAAPDMLAALGISVAEDAWRTPMRIIIDGETWRVVSAGSDRAFIPDSWSKPIAMDAAEDIVFENGKFTRYLDLAEYMRAKVPQTVAPVSQPSDPLREATNGWYRPGGGVIAPEIVKRVDPVYPDEIRKLRIDGLVILQVAVGADGAVEDVRLIRSLTPDLDVSAMNAVKQWQYKPATLDRNAVPSLVTVTVRFKLQ